MPKNKNIGLDLLNWVYKYHPKNNRMIEAANCVKSNDMSGYVRVLNSMNDNEKKSFIGEVSFLVTLI